MVRVSRLVASASLGLVVACACCAILTTAALAQPGKSKAKPKPPNSAEVKKLDAKLEEVQGAFLRDTVSIIKGYEDTGQLDRAKVLLEVLQKLDPKNDQIKKKIEQLDDQMLDQSEFDVDLDPAKPWQQIGIVAKDRMIRLEVEGEYKFVASIPVGPDGLPSKDPSNDFISGVPLGAVVAVILPPNSASGGNNAKPPNPFTVGAKFEQAAQRDGTLLLKVNVPPGSKCTGKLKVKVGGVVKA